MLQGLFSDHAIIHAFLDLQLDSLGPVHLAYNVATSVKGRKGRKEAKGRSVSRCS